MKSSMYNRLLLLPIFTGLTTAELTQILANMHLEFQQYGSGEVIVSQDERCDKLIYVLNGKVRAEHVDLMHKFVLKELIDKPFIIELFSIYGLVQNYEHSYITKEHTEIFIMSKQEFHNIMLNYKIPRTNAMNILCAKIQKQRKLLSEEEARTVEGKIVQFLCRTLLTYSGEKELQMKMEDMATHIQETRLSVSNALKHWNKLGLIQQPRREIIRIPEMYDLHSLAKQIQTT